MSLETATSAAGAAHASGPATAASVARAWPLRPVWYLGEVSYGIYLWHMFAVKLCVRLAVTPLQALWIALGLTILLAATSWHFLEKPILDYGRRLHGSAPRRQAAAAGGS